MINYVTCMSKEIYDTYGNKNVSSIYSEDYLETEYNALQMVDGWEDFYEQTKHITPHSFLFDVNRFCHKVFAQLDAFGKKERYVCWLDADTVQKAKPDDQALIKMLDGHMCAHLGRKGSYSETGFLLFDTQHEDFPYFYVKYKEMYTKKYIFLEDIWVDCRAFDVSIKGLSAKNLTPWGKGFEDVFSQSPISLYWEHKKGARKHEV